MNTDTSFRPLSTRPSCKVFSNPGRSRIDLRSALAQARNIVIVGHHNPDGDAVGSAFALYRYLKNTGKRARVVFPNNCAKNLTWMDADNIAINYLHQPEACREAISGCDLLFVMDFNRLSRTDAMAGLLQEKEVRRIMIDHHLEPDWESFDLAFSDTSVSSTCELLYNVFYAELDPESIDSHVGACLYAGISTDTGSFSYSCAHKELFSTIADLIDKGLDTVRVHQNIFDNFSESRTRLLGCCLGERLIVKHEYRTAYMYLNDADMKKYEYQSGDTEGIVNYGLSMAGIRFAAFFTQRDTRVRMSFRSQGNIDVNLFAKEHFNGGGHKNAAGGMSTDSLEETIRKFESVLPEFYEKRIRPALEEESEQDFI